MAAAAEKGVWWCGGGGSNMVAVMLVGLSLRVLDCMSVRCDDDDCADDCVASVAVWIR